MRQRQDAVTLPASADAELKHKRLFQLLSPETKRRFVAWMEWAVGDGQQETDPRNCDPWWQEFESRRRSL